MDILFFPVTMALQFGRATFSVIIAVLVIIWLYRVYADVRENQINRETYPTRGRVISHAIFAIALIYLGSGFISGAPKLALDVPNRTIEDKLDRIDSATHGDIPPEATRHRTEKEMMDRLDEADVQKTKKFKDME